MDAIYSAPFRRLLWKEWRSVRGFAIALLVFGLGLLYFTYQGAEQGFGDSAQFILPMVPLIALIGIIATTFAAEHEHGTASFQRSMPVRLETVVASKFVIGLAVSIGIGLVIVSVAYLMDPNIFGWIKPGPTFLAACELFAWGTLVSLLSRRALVALVASSLIAVGVTWTVSYVIAPNTWDVEDPRHFLLLATRWTIVALVSLTSVAVGSAWFNDRADEITSRWTRFKRSNTQALASRSADVNGGALSRLARLTWCQWKADAWLIVALLIGGVVATLLSFNRYNAEFAAIVCVLIFTVLGGIAGSRSEQQRRFLSMQSISPRMIWFGALLIPCLLALLVMFFHYERFLELSRSYNHRFDSDYRLLLVAGPLLGVAIGFFAGRYARSSVTSFGISILTGCFVVAWLMFAGFLDVPAVYSVVPALLTALLATLITTKAWVYLWSDKRSKVIAAGLAGAAIVLSVGCFGWFRAIEIPTVSPSQLSLVALPEGGSDSDLKSFRDVAKAVERYTEVRRGWDDPADVQLVDRIVRGLDENQFVLPVSEIESSDQGTFDSMRRILDLAIRDAVVADESTRARRLIDATFELNDLSHRCGFAVTRWGWHASSFPDSIYDWAVKSDTTPDQLREVAEKIESSIMDHEDIGRSIAVQAKLARDLAAGRSDWNQVPRDRMAEFGLSLSRWLPWESIRMDRFLDMQEADAWQARMIVFEGLDNHRPPNLPRFEYTDHNMIAPQHMFETAGEREMVFSIRASRAMAVKLALIWYQKVNDGALPDTVLALDDVLSSETLIDPLQAQPFILIHPDAMTQWLAENETTGWVEGDPDRLQVYRDAFLWSPDFLTRREPDSTRTEPRFSIVDSDSPPLPIDRLLWPDPRLMLKSHVNGKQFAVGTGVVVPIPSVDGSSEQAP